MTDLQIKNMISKKLAETDECTGANIDRVWHFTLTPLSNHPDEWELAVDDAIKTWHAENTECPTCESSEFVTAVPADEGVYCQGCGTDVEADDD